MLPESIESHPIAAMWEPNVAERYRAFARVVAGRNQLETTIGRGGLSFYAHRSGKRIFVCHFNAAPRSGRDDLGFADFKPAAIEPHAHPDAVAAELQRRLGPEITLRRGKEWYGAHFARERDADVAAAFHDAIVVAVFGRR